MYIVLHMFPSLVKHSRHVRRSHLRITDLFNIFFSILLKNIRVTYDKWKFYHMNIISDSQSYNIYKSRKD